MLAMLIVIGGMTGMIEPGVGKAYAAESFAGGIGTSTAPYQIASADQLDAVRENLGAYYELIDNIDLGVDSGYASGEGWLPIGDNADKFQGHIDGNGFEITNLTINWTSDEYRGLFGSIGEQGVVTNMKLEDVHISGYRHIGGLAGENAGAISNSYATGNVSGDVGEENDSAYVGGLVGRNMGQISTSYSSASVSGNETFGVGGLVGESYGLISNSHATGSVSGTGRDNVGGLVGNNVGPINQSYATGSVSGVNYVGGLAGYSGDSISDSHATGNVTSTGAYLGGLVGFNGRPISGSYATGNVSGTSQSSPSNNVGGLVGYNIGGTISTSYAIGAVSGNQNAGGLVGQNDSGIIGDDCFYRMETTSLSSGTAIGTTKLNDVGVGLEYSVNDGEFTSIDATSVDFSGLNVGDVIHVRVIADASEILLTVGLTDIRGATPPVLSADEADNQTANDIELTFEDDLAWREAITAVEDGDTALVEGSQYTIETGKITIAAGVLAQGDHTITVTATGYDDVQVDQSVNLKYAGAGAGTLSDPYQIATADQLNQVRYFLGASFKLTATIDLSTYTNWEPVGNNDARFEGSLDGNGFQIINLHINRSAIQYQGLVGVVGSSGKLTNMQLRDVSIQADEAFIGSLAGRNYGTISNSSVTGTGTVHGGNFVGGLVGWNEGTFTSSYATVYVSTAGAYSGGLAGYSKGTVSNSYATGNVDGFYTSAGLVGQNEGHISNSYYTGIATGTSFVGGLVGQNFTSNNTNNYYNSEAPRPLDSAIGEGKTTLDMQMKSTYANWNFDSDWYIIPGQFPQLWAFTALTPGTDVGTTKLNHVASGMEVSLDNGDTYTAITGDEPFVDSINVNIGDQIFVRIVGDPSSAKILTVRLSDIRPTTAPTTATLAAGTEPGTTMLNGVTDTMEYQVNAGPYTAIAGTSADNIFASAGDKIYVRAAATTQKPASEAQELTVDAANITPALPVSIRAIAGVTAPVAGEAPVTTIAATTEYTAKITWPTAGSTFGGNKVYTATIVIKPTAGYTLADVTESFFTIAGATTVTNTAGSGVVKAVFPETDSAPITIADIVGVTEPVIGETPVTTIAATSEYTATVEWSPSPVTFADNTSYTSTITITPKAGYTLTGVNANFFRVAGATTVTNDADSGVVTAVFPKTAAIIASQAIVGVTPPVTGAAPVTTIAATEEYTAAVAWSSSPVTFEGNTAYTATIMITPTTGHTLAGLGTDFFTVEGATTVATVTNEDGTATVTAEFPVTATVIAESAIAGVTPPVTGEAPVITIEATAEYTAAITWSSSPEAFAGNTAYTATITITPKAGYTLAGVGSTFFTVEGATTVTTVISEDGTGVVTAEFPETENTSPTASSVTITGTAKVGVQLTGMHTFNDSDTGDTEGTSTFRWLSSSNGTTYNEIVGATSLAYTPVTGDLNKTIKFEVTPVDNHGLAGTPVLSNATLAVAAATARPSGSGGGSGSTLPNDTTLTSTDGTLTLPAGRTGEVSLNDEVTVFIPADASVEELKLTIEKVLDAQKLLTENDVLSSPVYEILKNFSENFSKPVTLTLKFDPASLTGDQRPAVFYYDEVKKAWVEVGGTVNGDHITVDVNHFTKYAVFAVGDAAEVPATEPSPDNTKPTITFSDISGHWAESDIKQAVSGGIVGGYPDGTFRPKQTVTRAEFTVMLVNTLKPQGEGAKLAFTDEAKIGAWAQKAVAQAVQAGWIKGYDDWSFRPNALITRAEMAAMIASALGQSNVANAVIGFADDKDIPAWAKAGVSFVKQAGIVQGKGDNRFAPQDKATRAEAVTVLLKMQAQISK
ncbi:The GLUG motif-containing protein [Paenibacillus sp. OV219]|nr:The GLUG motif-containing protein [Paenibacillus sp. OV219]